MDKNYQDAMATIVAADKQTINDTAGIVSNLKAAHDDARTKLQAILDGYAGMDGPMLGARSTVSSIVAQLAMMDFTITNVANIAQSAVATYNPPADPTAPAPAAAPGS